MSVKVDEKKENIQTIKKNIKNAQSNAEFANDIINSVSDYEAKMDLTEKNNNRINEINKMIDDVKNKVNDEYK